MSKRNPKIIYNKTCLTCGKRLNGRQRKWCGHICEVTSWQKKNQDKSKLYKINYVQSNPEKRKQSIKKYDASAGGKKKRAEWCKLNKRAMRELSVIQTQKRRGKLMGLAEHFTLEQWLELKKKYEFTCLCCLRKEPEIILTIDHIVSLALGGKNTIDNIQPLCGTCNRKKRRDETDYRQ